METLKESFPPSLRTRRATVACTRCRRHRSRCRHDGARPPCVGCREAGPAVAATCKFIGRGGKEVKGKEINLERIETALPADTLASPHDSPSLVSSTDAATEETYSCKLLPDEEVIEACTSFMNCYFQLGFLPKVLFLDRLEKDRGSVNEFLLVCILGVSARFTPSLVRRFGGPAEATRTFVDRAESMVPTEIYKPSLEALQGFILLGTSEWANGDRNRSLIHLGIAATMVGMLGLHREETYSLPENATPEEIINSEMARRTLWVMGMQRNLFAGHNSPVPFSLNDITTLLPCEENEFAFGLIPKTRAALPGSQAAIDHPELVDSPSRSLFATLIQAHNLWGRVARGACLDAKKKNATTLWDSGSQFSQLSTALNKWEAGLPSEHRWSEWYLRIYKTENLDLAYLTIFLAIRLSNIVLRRTHLEDMKAAIINAETPSLFWEKMSLELFTNFISLYEGIGTYLTTRSLMEGFPPILAFSVYLCGSLATHLWKCPRLCPRLALRAEGILKWSLEVLVELRKTWPMAERWHKALQMSSVDLSSLSPQDVIPKDQIDSQDTLYPNLNIVSDNGSQHRNQRHSTLTKRTQSHLGSNVPMLESLGMYETMMNNSTETFEDTLSIEQNLEIFDDFEAELASYLQEDVHLGKYA